MLMIKLPHHVIPITPLEIAFFLLIKCLLPFIFISEAPISVQMRIGNGNDAQEVNTRRPLSTVPSVATSSSMLRRKKRRLTAPIAEKMQTTGKFTKSLTIALELHWETRRQIATKVDNSVTRAQDQ